MKYLLLILTLFTSATICDSLLVPSEYPSIQNAISAAQNGDTVLVSPGEYGGPISFLDKNIVVLSTHGANNTLIRTFTDYHCVSITGGQDSTAVLEGFTVRNQISDGASLDKQEVVDHGGGLYITNSSPTIRNNIIKDCVAETGGGLYLQHSSMFMSDCDISNNTAFYYAGGLFIGSSDGTDPPYIVDCTITNNHAQDGGGFYIWGDTAVVINNNICDNYLSTNGNGGGIGISSTNVLLCGNYISCNTGGSGGGVFIGGAITTIIGNLIAENTAGKGGGVACSGGYLLLENNTICLNTAMSDPYGTGGLRITQCDTTLVVNNIIWCNQAPNGTVPNLLVYDTYLTVSYSNIGGGYDSIWVDSTSTLNWGPGNIDMDPLFETGPLGDYHLSTSSPCIDAGNPASEYNDPEDPFNPGYALWPAMGFIRNDMGAFGGSGINYWLTVEEEGSSAIEGVLLLKSFPNPFSSSCTVCYQLDEASRVNLSVYDLSGRLVETLVDASVPAGMYSEYFDASGLCSGMYLIRLAAGGLSTSRRCVVVR